MIDALVIGGGFFGCEAALQLQALGQKVLLVEQRKDLLQRASYVNQARVHNGYHYPRSVLTALRSRINFPRFVRDYNECVYSAFDKYYAVAKLGSFVTSEQFRLFIERVGAEIEPLPQEEWKWYNPDMIDGVFKVREYAFDAVKLKEIVRRKLAQSRVNLREGVAAERLTLLPDGLFIVRLSDGTEVRCRYVFNCTYSQLNGLLVRSGLSTIPLKHELAEMALVEVPPELKKTGITVMDGPFFSVMPFPARGLHSFSHVRYTPHTHWYDRPNEPYVDGDAVLASHWKTGFHAMVKDSARYMPILEKCVYRDSIREVKTVLPKSEVDDSRPILFRPSPEAPRLFSIMGGKIDNIYDIQEVIAEMFANESASQ